MNTYSDQDIESIITTALDRFLNSSGASLSFETSHDGFIADWNSRGSYWQNNSDDYALDALSCVLIQINPEPNRDGCDELTIATICKLFNRRIGWVLSFQKGWQGLPNSSDSITGYSLGLKLRNRYNKDV